jgi:outer membrane lipoprotein LolB
MAAGAEKIARRSRAAKRYAAFYPLIFLTRFFRFVFYAAVVLAAAGCMRPGGLSDDDEAQRLWASRQQAVAALDSWDIHARAALTLKGEAYNIGLNWERTSDRFMLLLEAPFGQGVFRIDGDVGGPYRLRLPDGQVFTNATPEALLEEVVGWSLPIGGLEFWIRGIPQPGADYRPRLDASGRARSIRQDSWDISYLDYFDAQPAPQLPRRIKLSRDELTLKLVIERWQQTEIEPDTSDLFPEFN